MKYIDIHSHVLPQMDDGSKSMEQSLSMLRIAESEHIGVIYVTPHNMPGKGHPSRESILKRINLLQETARQENINIVIKQGTEYYYRQEVLDLLEQEKGITLGDSECVLVEFEPMAEKMYIRNGIREILSLGYTPVVAHVERYAAMMEKGFQTLTEIKKMGALIQVNASSVTGDNGFKTKSNVKNMLKLGLVDFVGTDAHSDGKRAPYMEKCASVLYNKYAENYADALLYGNAQRLL